jgi:hypothetical protein
MMLRNEWVFDYTTEEVRNAADRKVAYHRERLEAWEAEHQLVMDRVKESGLDIRARDVTGGKRHELVLDPELAKRLDECENKIAGHQRKRDEYELWFKVLNEADDLGESMALHHDDVVYFGLHSDPVIEGDNV